VPHTTFSQEPLPVHSTLHDVLPLHDTPTRHELSESHFTSHAQPAGHATLPLQFAPFAQSMMQVCVVVTQLEHGEGQSLPSTGGGASPLVTGASICSVPEMTQNPPTQSRGGLVLQSDVFVQVNRSLLCVIEQLVARANTNAT
jgi:hypothetical protein